MGFCPFSRRAGTPSSCGLSRSPLVDPIECSSVQAAGVPVVATSVGGVPELIEDGKNGCLVPPRDVDALVTQIRALLCDPGLRNRIGSAGFTRVRDHFAPAQMIASFTQLYDELLAATGTR